MAIRCLGFLGLGGAGTAVAMQGAHFALHTSDPVEVLEVFDADDVFVFELFFSVTCPNDEVV